MADAAIKPGHFTYGDYCGWPDDERWELIDGVAYPWHPGPAPTRSHQQVLRDLLVQITLVLKGGSCEVYPAPFDVRLSDTDEADEHIQTVLQPDIAVICDQPNWTRTDRTWPSWTSQRKRHVVPRGDCAPR